MHTTNRVPEPSSPPLGLLQAAKEACLVTAWDLSGMLVGRYYERLLQQHGRTPQALAERADDKDLEFYQHLFERVDLSQPFSVLDIGCGMGDLIDFLQLRQASITAYLGIDLVGPFIEVCRQEYLPPCEFQKANFISRSFAPAERFDLVVNMGVLVSRVLSYEAYVEHCIEKMISLSSKYVLFNIITEVDMSLGNYRQAHRLGHITYLPKPRLTEILDRVTSRAWADYTIHELRIYPDATDAFVRITIDA
ncbi:MAG TPA: class I SAM-dependent methyltransferase [Roseiflexaceae bacterium]|nr:class I SAM-dependent methyltransferase [Roseiflexaceae bacterium]